MSCGQHTCSCNSQNRPNIEQNNFNSNRVNSNLLYAPDRVGMMHGSVRQRRSAIRTYQIRGRTSINTWESNNYAYEQYDLFVDDGFGTFSKATPALLAGCTTNWGLTGYESTATFISRGRTSLGGGLFAPVGGGNNFVVNDIGDPAITTIFLFALRPSSAQSQRTLKIDCWIAFCNDFELDSNPNPEISITLDRLSPSNELPPGTWPCEFEISGPDNLSYRQTGLYEPTPHEPGASYSYQLTGNSSWIMTLGNNNMNASVRLNSRIETSPAYLCITKSAPGCAPTVKCIRITPDFIGSGTNVNDWSVSSRCGPRGIFGCAENLWPRPISVR